MAAQIPGEQAPRRLESVGAYMERYRQVGQAAVAGGAETAEFFPVPEGFAHRISSFGGTTIRTRQYDPEGPDGITGDERVTELPSGQKMRFFARLLVVEGDQVYAVGAANDSAQLITPANTVELVRLPGMDEGDIIADGDGLTEALRTAA